MRDSASETLQDERLLCPQHHHRLVGQRGPTVCCGHAYRYAALQETAAGEARS